MLLLLLACTPAPAPEPPAPELPAHQVFPSSEAALEALMAKGPRLLAVGEVHSSTEGPARPATITLFRQRLLPVVAPHVTDLVIETWRLNEACGAQAVAVVEQVTEETHRPPETKSEIVQLAEAAQALNVRPHDLVLACAEYAGLQDAAGEIDYGALLALLTVKMGEYAQEGLKTPDARLVIYGGAVHNDLNPREGAEAYSYAVAARAVGGEAVIELDLYDPSVIREKESLLEPSWAPLLEQTGPDRALLYERQPGSYVLLMEATGGG